MLPAEIVDFIFSFLQNDTAALESCSAAHSLLSSIAEPHLFGHITIYMGNFEAPGDGFLVARLARHLSERPYLASLIRSVTIDARSIIPGVSIVDDSTFEELSTLLALITHSEELLLRNIRWPRLSPTFRSALLDFLRTTHLKGFSLQNSHFFPLSNLLAGLTNIKNLTIKSSRYVFKPGVYSILTSLQSLSLVHIHLDDFTAWAGRLRLNSLISLHARLYPCPNLSPLFTTCSRSLTTLTLEIGTFFQTTYCKGIHSSVVGPLDGIPFNLSSLTSLELLTIHAKIRAQTTEGIETPHTSTCHSALLAITQLVSSAGPSLKRVVLNLQCSVGVARDLRDAVEWGALVQLCDWLIHLRVDLCIRAFAGRLVLLSFVEVVDSLLGNENLSRLVKQGSLVINPLAPVFPHDMEEVQ